jgi:hypothetical protein
MSEPHPVLADAGPEAALRELYERLPGYTPGWSPSPGTAGAALLAVAARYAAILGAGVNRLPERAMLGFLDRLGVALLPAQSARAPLLFELIPDSPVDVTLPANSQAAAPPQVEPPSPLLAAEAEPASSEEVVFATTRTITLARATLAALHSLDPGSDAFADHSAAQRTGFTFFDDLGPIEHALYLGQNTLFALAGEASVILSLSLAGASPPGNARGIALGWEYLSADGWLPLTLVEDRTNRLTRGGLVVLEKGCGPDAAEETIAGRTSYWLRARLRTGALGTVVTTAEDPPVAALVESAGQFQVGDVVTTNGVDRVTIAQINVNRVVFDRDIPGLQRGSMIRLAEPLPGLVVVGDAPPLLPVLDDVRARVAFTKEQLLPEAAFTDVLALDTSKDFYPFGRQPARYTTFFLAAKEVFQRRDARIELDLTIPAGESVSPSDDLDLSFEYFDGQRWKLLPELRDNTEGFSVSGRISFRCPRDWAEGEVNGQKNYWMRVRITAGDYGHPLRLSVDTSGAEPEVSVEQSTLAPPVLEELTLQYTYQTEQAALDHCLTFNEFVYEDRTEDCRWPRRIFQPFRPISDRQPALYMGFSRPLPIGLMSLYLAVPPEAVPPEADAEASPYVWEYASPRGWSSLGVLDETLGFQRSGMIQFVGPRDAMPTQGLGGALFRVRARLKQGERPRAAPARGIWLNAVWGAQRRSFERDLLGSSDGTPGQSFFVRPERTPVLAGQLVEVREWAGRGADWETVAEAIPAADLRLERDPASDAVVAVWARYHERTHLYGSNPDERHYTVERAGGQLRFGDGRYGAIPPVGGQIVLSYSAGGGLAGNVPPGAIAELRTAVPYLIGVSNIEAAAGGSATEGLANLLGRGPQRLRHGERALSAADVEWNAREASPAVAIARCLPLVGPDGPGQRGWVTLAITPWDASPQPAPTPELLRQVRAHLAARVPAPLARRIRVLAVAYTPVSVVAEVVPRQLGEAAQVETRLLRRLDAFLHPLTGGPEGRGWAFGQGVYLSQIASLIERTPGVDYARRIGLRVRGAIFEDIVAVPDETIVAAGAHELKLLLEEG